MNRAEKLHWGSISIPNTLIPLPTQYSAINLLKASGYKINDKKLQYSLKNSKVPGRFEVVKKDPLIILDGAHNPVKVKTFLKSLTRILPNKKFIFLVAFKKDKDIEQMLKLMKPHSKTFVVCEFTKITDMGRRFTTPVKGMEEILKKLNFSGKVLVEKDSAKALKKAKKAAGKDNTIVITGSLYLIGEIRDIFFPS